MSDLPQSVGLCRADLPGVASYVNAAQRRLVLAPEAGDEGWWGTWAEMAFTVSQTNPYLTLPREVARIEAIGLCGRAVIPQNQFWEYLEFGNGRLPKLRPDCNPWNRHVLSRNVVPTATDLGPAPQLVRVYALDPTDANGTSRVLIQGTDTTGNPVVSQDQSNPIQGEYMLIASPFAQFPLTLNTLTGLQKDTTNGPVQFFQVDPTTGAQVLLAQMEPDEQVSAYRRYYFHRLPLNCCQNDPNSGNTVPITAIVKLELLPVRSDSDYCLIQNLEAIIEESQAIRLSRVDALQAKQEAAMHHKNAIGFLNSELIHYLGRDAPAVNFKPFGSAPLSRLNVGMM